MKNLLITALAAITLALPAQAQHYRNSRYYNQRTHSLDYSRDRYGNRHFADGIYYGLRIGPAFSTVNSDDPDLDGSSSQTGLDIGFVIGYPLSYSAPVYLETGLSYIEKGGKKDLGSKKMTYDLNYLELPILVKYIYDVDGHFTIQPLFGGYFSCGVGGKIKNYADRDAFNSFSGGAFRRFDAGLRVGCGVGYDLFYGELSYDIGLANICHDTFDKSRNGCLALTFGVNF